MRSDFYVGVVTVLFSGLALLDLYRSKASAFGISDLDSNSFPKIVVWVLLGFGLLLTLREIVKKNVRLPSVDIRKLYGRYRKPVGVLLLILVYIVLLGDLGFFVTTTLFILSTTLYIGGREKPVRSVVITVGAVAVLYVIFRLWLGQILPGGWLI